MARTATGNLDLILTRSNRVKSQFLIAININATDQINEFNKRVKVNLSIILYGNTNELLYCLPGKLRATPGKFASLPIEIGHIDPAITKARNIHPHITWNGQRARSFCER